MKYYLIAGEASGDLHASHLMKALQEKDPEAEFRYYGGDRMKSVGGTLVRHYETLAYMGFVQVVLHLRTILNGMRSCREDIAAWRPDCLILVDYPGFNLKMAQWVKTNTSIPVFYYISPKIWAWKEGRIHLIKQYVDRLFCILPFEVSFFRKHSYEVDYVGNPSLDEVEHYLSTHAAPAAPPTILIMPGSRKAEIASNLPRMLAAVSKVNGYDVVVSRAPHLPEELFAEAARYGAQVSTEPSFSLLHRASAALVTSGTATLETALFRVPQVVCYYVRGGWALRLLRRLFLKVPFISLVNLVAERKVVTELVGPDMTAEAAREQLVAILPGGSRREKMLRGYEEVRRRLGTPGAPAHTAALIIDRLDSPQSLTGLRVNSELTTSR
ncbi:MAG: lipid-A-disaccharide synthase [Bacteroidaceae bacterium]|nr:lipid-A-disaccharide synthase [Bacteroidaceae bacterium]